jgi:hypothetical protein
VKPLFALAILLAAATPAFAQGAVVPEFTDLPKSLLEAPPEPADPQERTALQKWEAWRKDLPFTFNGGTYLWHYEPFIGGAKNHTEIYWVYLTLDFDFDQVGFHFEPMFRDTKLRPFFNSNVWIQEAYAYWKLPWEGMGVLKAGKIYGRFGRFWDNCFYGNIPYFDGTKLDPDLGLSWEVTHKIDDALSVETYLQYFEEDGETNGSLQGRDTLSLAGAEQGATWLVRAAPTLNLSDTVAITVGFSAMAFKADLVTEDEDVGRLSADVWLKAGPFSIFVDYAHQNGHHVTGFPLAGVTEDDIDWVMSGTTYTWDWLMLRYNFSLGEYNDTSRRELLHMPAATLKVHQNLSLMVEYVHWRRMEPGSDETIDNSLNLVVYVSF